RRLRRRLPGRREGRLRGALPARAREARARRAGRRRQRALARRDARRVLAGAPGGPLTPVRDRPARPGPRAVRHAPGRLIHFRLTAERRWSESGDFQYGQWRYQRVEVRPRDLRGIASPAWGPTRYAPP